MPKRLPRTKDEVLRYLLGAPPGVSVAVNGTEYVLPLGVDPYWQDFGCCYGYELLPEDERPRQVGPSHEMWQPGRARPGFVAGDRQAWLGLPAPVASHEPRLTWQALGDLRRCVCLASSDPSLLLPEGRSEAGAEYLVSLLRTASSLQEEIETSRRFWPLPEARTQVDSLFQRLEAVQAALDKLFGELDALEAGAQQLLPWVRAHERAAATGAAGPLPPPYSRPRRGRPPEALLVVHAANHYFKLSGPTDEDGRVVGPNEPTPQEIAMVVALEPDVQFGKDATGSQFLGDAEARDGAVRFWRDRLRDYGAPAKTG